MTPPCRRRVSHTNSRAAQSLPGHMGGADQPEGYNVTNNQNPDEFLTQPLSLGLRLGQPAIASPETWDAPIWTGKPPVERVTYAQPRRSFRQYVIDEAPGLSIAAATVTGVAYLIAQVWA